MKKHSPDWHKSHATRYARSKLRTCTYRNCGAPHRAHGLCTKHYEWLRKGKIKTDAMDNVAVNYHVPSLRVLPCRICGAPKYYTICIVCGVLAYA